MRVENRYSWVLPVSVSACLMACANVPDDTPALDTPWQQTLQTCRLPAAQLAQRAASLQYGDPMVCRRALEFGRQLACVARTLPTVSAAAPQHTEAGIAGFTQCIEPLAAGLLAGRLSAPADLAATLRHCVALLDAAPAQPPTAPGWWQRHAPSWWLPTTLDAIRPPPLALPATTAPAWPDCETSRALRPAATTAPARPASPTPVERPAASAPTALSAGLDGRSPVSTHL